MNLTAELGGRLAREVNTIDVHSIVGRKHSINVSGLIVLLTLARQLRSIKCFACLYSQCIEHRWRQSLYCVAIAVMQVDILL